MINRIQKPQNIEDHRMFQRIPADFPMKLKNNSQDREGKAFCWDISAVGVGIFSKDKLEVSDKMEMCFELPEKYNPLQLSGEVVWVKETQPQVWRSGIKFFEIHLMDLSLLLRILHEAG